MSHSSPSERAGAILSIDLDALANNWRLYRDMALPNNAQAGAVVKASAYGIDVHHAAPALLKAGCRTFFVASIDEGIVLRNILGPGPTIHIFYGLMAGTACDFVEHDLIPILNSLGEVDRWQTFCTAQNTAFACDLHIDTGMSRLGLDEAERQTISDDPERINDLNIDTVMSHLVSAEAPNNPESKRQLDLFQTAIRPLAPKRISLANSAGAFLGPEYHFDTIRPGVALYGGNPTPTQTNPMAQVIRLQAKILQVRKIDTPGGVGYGSTYQADSGTRIATLAAGYADGYPRSLSNAGHVYIGEHRALVIGRVSMDLITIDVTSIPDDLVQPGMFVDLIGPLNGLDDVANKANTISYEILTQLGTRYHRVYTGGDV